MSTPTDVGLQFSELKGIVWMVSVAVGVLVSGGSAAWWYAKQQSQTKKELYIKINSVQRDLAKKMDESEKVCTNTRERVGLVEQSHSHLEKRMDGMDDKLDSMMLDISATKDSLTSMTIKQAEAHLNVVGELRNISDKLPRN